MSGATLTISKKNLLHNISLIKDMTNHKKIYAVLKANAYGSDLHYVSDVLKDQVNGFALARIDEALLLVKKHQNATILLLEGVFNEDELLLSLEHNFEIVVHSHYQLELLEQVQSNYQIKVWLKINTGMNRLGFDPCEFNEVYNRLSKVKVVKEIGFLSHFSSAENLDDNVTEKQIEIFNKTLSNYQGEKSLSASNGILHWKEAHFDMVRPGILMHGVSPANQDLKNLGFKPTMTLKAPIIAIYPLKKGQRVGYGGSYISEKDTNIAILAIGYGDGFPIVTSETKVWLNNRLVPIIGRVAMDMTAVDLGDVVTDNIGDQCEMWGENMPIETLAKSLNTIAYELMTRISRRVEIIYDES